MGATSQDVVPHPRALVLGGVPVAVLVEDQPDAMRPIVFGEPTLGWVGDHRIALYYWVRATAKASTYVLARLCDDGDYRIVLEWPANDRPLSPAGVNLAIRRLVAADARRGADPYASIIAHNDAVEAEQVKRNDEWVDEEIAPRLAWAYGRDRATHIGGRFDQHTVPAVPWHESTEAVSAEKE